MKRLIRMYQSMRSLLLLFIAIDTYSPLMNRLFPTGHDMETLHIWTDWIVIWTCALTFIVILKAYPRNPRYIYMDEE